MKTDLSKYPLTQSALMESAGLKWKQQLNRYRRTFLKENTHYIKLTNRFFMYSEEAVKIIKEKRK